MLNELYDASNALLSVAEDAGSRVNTEREQQSIDEIIAQAEELRILITVHCMRYIGIAVNKGVATPQEYDLYNKKGWNT